MPNDKDFPRLEGNPSGTNAALIWSVQFWLYTVIALALHDPSLVRIYLVIAVLSTATLGAVIAVGMLNSELDKQGRPHEK